MKTFFVLFAASLLVLAAVPQKAFAGSNAQWTRGGDCAEYT
jgi:hypothetical protein